MRSDRNLIERYLYTTAQIHAYYDRISLPNEWRMTGEDAVATVKDPRQALAFLTTLQLHHVAHIPFENLELHYSNKREISIDPDSIFHKIVELQTGRGGYCLESNIVFATALRTIGFHLYPTGARVKRNNAFHSQDSGAQYNGWGHLVHIVTLVGRRYVVDVAYGNSGPTTPMSLDDSSISPSINCMSQMKRLVQRETEDSIRTGGDGPLLWFYETQNQHQDPWETQYCFSELEFTPSDFAVMNFCTSQYTIAPFRENIICTKYIMKNSQIIGFVTLINHQLKRREYDKKIKDVVLKSEEERHSALCEEFGIVLSQNERIAIQGSPAEIK